MTGDDVSDRGFQRVGERLKMFNRAFMSWTMRVLAVNVFVLSLVSYSNRKVPDVSGSNRASD